MIDVDKGSGASQGFSVYCPAGMKDFEGWYWLGQTLDPNWSLLVQEVIPGSLCPIATTQRLWDSAVAPDRQWESKQVTFSCQAL